MKIEPAEAEALISELSKRSIELGERPTQNNGSEFEIQLSVQADRTLSYEKYDPNENIADEGEVHRENLEVYKEISSYLESDGGNPLP